MDQGRVVRPGFDQHQLGRAAADIEHHGRTLPRFEQQVAAHHGQPRLFLGADDVEQDARFLAHAGDEFGAVGCAAAGLGRDRAGQVDIAALQLVGTDLQRGKRPVHRRVAQPAGLGQSFAQPDHAAERIDDDEVLGLGTRDQQAAIVGAKVDCGESLTLKRGASLGLLPGRLGPAGATGAVRRRISRTIAGRSPRPSVRFLSVPTTRRRRIVRHVQNHSLSFSRGQSGRTPDAMLDRSGAGGKGCASSALDGGHSRD